MIDDIWFTAHISHKLIVLASNNELDSESLVYLVHDIKKALRTSQFGYNLMEEFESNYDSEKSKFLNSEYESDRDIVITAIEKRVEQWMAYSKKHNVI